MRVGISRPRNGTISPASAASAENRHSTPELSYHRCTPLGAGEGRVDSYWEVEETDRGLRVGISGAITETFDGSRVLETARGPVDLDLGGIERINSSGVREWLRFIQALTRDRPVRLHNCAVLLVQQFNMISNMSGGATICSIMLPYHCDDCESDAELRLDLTSGSGLTEEVDCPNCGGTMFFDDFPDFYLAFLKTK